MILITLSLFIHSLIISSVYLSLYLYLYTDYYSVYRTFICIAHLPFQLLSFRNLWGDYKLEFMERKLWSVISVYWTGPTSQFWLMARTLFFNQLRPLSIAKWYNFQHLITYFRHKDILAATAKTRSKMATTIAFSGQDRDFKIQRRGGNENVPKISEQDTMGACTSASWLCINCECGGIVRNDIFPEPLPYQYPYFSSFV